MNEMGTGGAGLYVYNKRPHPNATRVFVNWILSKDIQLGLAKATLQDLRGARICPPSRSRSASRSKARIISRPSAKNMRRTSSMRSNSSARSANRPRKDRRSTIDKGTRHERKSATRRDFMGAAAAAGLVGAAWPTFAKADPREADSSSSTPMSIRSTAGCPRRRLSRSRTAASWPSAQPPNQGAGRASRRGSSTPRA